MKEVGAEGEVEVKVVSYVVVFNNEGGVIPDEGILCCVAIGENGEEGQKQQCLGARE